MSRNNAGQMRLQREARMAKKDIDTQIKKHGKMVENFICLPDPNNAYEWYYVIFGLEMKGFEGGFYLGKVECPAEYPAKAPKIMMITENGKWHLNHSDGICLSISQLHPESWNPAWKVNNQVLGLLSFWLGEETGTYGEISKSYHQYSRKDGMELEDHRFEFAKKSRKAVLEHPKFQEVFAGYESAIGIDKEQINDEIPAWVEYDKRRAAYFEEQRRKEEEARRKREAEKIR